VILELRIKDLGVIESTEVDLAPGLNVISGETGTGKTMVLSALDLLLGGRPDPARVRTDAQKTLVEGLWDPTDTLAEAVATVDGDVVDEGVMLARTVAASGRSGAFLGGRRVPAATLASIAEALVVVHGQADQQRLARPQTQRRLLDAYAGEDLAETLERYRSAHQRLRQRQDDLEELRSTTAERAQRAAFLRHALEDIEVVDPQPGEETVLAQEEERLSHAEVLREAVGTALSRLSEDAASTSGTVPMDALSAVASAAADLDRAAQHDSYVADLLPRLRSAQEELIDLATELSSHLSELQADPARLQQVAQRRADVQALVSRYGESSESVLEWSRQAAAELATLEDDGREARLSAEIEELRSIVGALARQLLQARSEAAARLSAAITAELRDLAMPQAEVVVSVDVRGVEGGSPPTAADVVGHVGDERWWCSPQGADIVSFGLQPYPRAEVVPLATSASGGELSRIMLAVEVTLAAQSPPPTLVFDEIDAGIGGAAAAAVGRRLKALAQHAQVLVVTHLAQVAAFGDHHLRVDRSDDGTTTTVRALVGEERVIELARMLSGRDESGSARQHAEELLQDAGAPTAGEAHVSGSRAQ
jgi:DNA repair protein RecN (Recombination protein N)